MAYAVGFLVSCRGRLRLSGIALLLRLLNRTQTMRILISGAWIAGPTPAYWLHQYGLEPTIVERSPQLRRDGYIIDFWGVGFDVAERMGLLPDIRREGYLVREVRVVGRNGNQVAGFPVDSVVIANGRYISIPRGELAALIYRTIEGSVETIFNDSIASSAFLAQSSAFVESTPAQDHWHAPRRARSSGLCLLCAGDMKDVRLPPSRCQGFECRLQLRNGVQLSLEFFGNNVLGYLL